MLFLTQGKTNWKFLLIVILLAVIAGGGIWFLSDLDQEKPITPEEDLAEHIEEKTADWETYRNEKYGFEIKYPKALILEESAIVRHPDTLGTVIRFPVGYIANSPITNAKIDIWVRDYGACKRHESLEDTYVILKQDFLINDITFQLGTWSYMPPSVGYEYMTRKNNQCYEITLILRGEDQKAFYDVVKVNNRQPEIFFDIIDKVITTFRFIEVTGDFCGWSTYGECSSDIDCLEGGCSGQVCESKSEESTITTCEWIDCYDNEAYGVRCKCIEGRCQWI